MTLFSGEISQSPNGKLITFYLFCIEEFLFGTTLTLIMDLLFLSTMLLLAPPYVDFPKVIFTDKVIFLLKKYS